jgi:hypothetical protein
MLAEAAIFAGDDGEAQIRRDAIERHPLPPQRPSLDLLRHHHRGEGRIDEAEQHRRGENRESAKE